MINFKICLLILKYIYINTLFSPSLSYSEILGPFFEPNSLNLSKDIAEFLTPASGS